jgi:hypothetical protein
MPNTDYPVTMMLELFRSLLKPELNAERAYWRKTSLLVVCEAATLAWTFPAVKC